MQDLPSKVCDSARRRHPARILDTRQRAHRQAEGRKVKESGPTRPHTKKWRPVMSDKSPRQTMTKKPGKSLKEKRAAKRAKAARNATTTEALWNTEKR
jgi:hypothetical protein